MRFFSLFFCWISATCWANASIKNVDVVVIGAGLSGLATAYDLKKHGLNYRVVEIAPRVGGRVRTVRYQFPDGTHTTADSGMEEYWESNPAVSLIKELRLPVRHDIAASSIVLNGKLEVLRKDEDSEAFLKRIFTPAEFSALQTFKEKVAPLLVRLKQGGQDQPPERDLLKLKDISFAKWVKKSGVPAKVADWIRVSLECEIGTNWDRISALDGIAEFHIFIGKQGKGEESYRVVGGNERFTDALANQVGRENIWLNKRVNRIETKDEGVTVSMLDMTTNAITQIRAKHVVSTIPLFRLFEVQFVPPLSDKKREAIASQHWGSYFKAHILLPAKSSRFWMKEGVAYTPILSDSELGVIYDGNPDEKRSSQVKVLSLLIGGDLAEGFNLMPLDQVRVTVEHGLERLWPGIKQEIQSVEFFRYHPRAIAAWPVGRSRFDALSFEVRRPENRVYFAGDFTETSHSDGAFLSASRVVRQILEAKRQNIHRSTATGKH